MKNNRTEFNDYLNSLIQDAKFSGDIASDITSRFVHATDNSIYQKIPHSVITPKKIEDIQILVKLTKRFPDIFFACRGGGTGTNGQSLTEGIMLDCRKHLNQILNINIEDGYIEVEAGAILNQVNTALKSKDYFFPVDISPSDRATIGGMISTDACGRGSYHHGRMGDNILEIKYIDSDGEIQIITQNSQPDKFKIILQLIEKNQTSINNNFPDHIRYATGYNLKKLLETQNFNYLFAGSEGTLGIIISAELKIKKILPSRALIINFYNHFDDSIADVTDILKTNPYAIEVMDEVILELAKQDETTRHIQKNIYLNNAIKAISLIEFNAYNEAELKQKLTKFELKHPQTLSDNYKIITKEEDIKAIYLLRKNAVGIAANLDSDKRPIPFIEDAAIPIRYLKSYIKDLKQLLDSYKLRYVIYGHADVGLIHVRPAMNLELNEDRKMLSEISFAVIKLVKKYDGVIWGEHSSGFRSSISERYFGSEIINIFQEIKNLCDSENIFNPGKIVTRNSKQNIKFNNDFQADFNKEITQDLKEEFQSSLLCNGNAKCLSNDDEQLMCPTYKITGNLKYSPKGRSQLIRLWLNFISKNPVPKNTNKKKTYAKKNKKLFSEIYDSLNSCLSCMACTTSCPVKVDITKHKSKFMLFYYQIYRKKLQVLLLENLEVILCKLYRIRKLSSYVIKLNLVKRLFEKVFNLSDINTKIKSSNITTIKKTVKGKQYIFADIVTILYAPEIIDAASKLLTKMNIEHEILEPLPSAIGYEHFGNLKKLNKYNQILTDKLSNADKVIILDPAIYHFMQKNLVNSVSIESFVNCLYANRSKLGSSIITDQTDEINFYSHCITNSMQAENLEKWQEIFTTLGITLNNVSQNCCGMAGFYGYQKENISISKKLYHENIEKFNHEHLVFDGISCYLQNNRSDHIPSEHIIHKLYQIVK